MLKTLRKKLKGKKGFTLIEMIVVVAIIAILIAILVPNVMKFVDTANEARKEANAKIVYTAAQAYCTDRYIKSNPVTSVNASDLIPYVSDSSILTGATIVIENGSVKQITMGDGVTKYPKTV